MLGWLVVKSLRNFPFDSRGFFWSCQKDMPRLRAACCSWLGENPGGWGGGRCWAGCKWWLGISHRYIYIAFIGISHRGYVGRGTSNYCIPWKKSTDLGETLDMYVSDFQGPDQQVVYIPWRVMSKNISAWQKVLSREKQKHPSILSMNLYPLTKTWGKKKGPLVV